MFNKTGCVMAMLIAILFLGMDWLISVGLVWLICLCFGWTFSWGIATGVWLVIILIRGRIKVKTNQ